MLVYVLVSFSMGLLIVESEDMLGVELDDVLIGLSWLYECDLPRRPPLCLVRVAGRCSLDCLFPQDIDLCRGMVSLDG